MGERGDSGPHCSRCGARCDGDGCASCSTASSGARVQLVALPGDAAPAPGDVRLVREIKGAAVRDPIEAAPTALQQLSGPVGAHAKPPGDESSNLLCGPGYRRRGRVSWRWLLWLLGLAAVAGLWG